MSMIDNGFSLMLICSFNFRGLGGRIKKSEVRGLIRSNSFDFLVIQDTKLFELSIYLVHSLWDNLFLYWSFYSYVEISGDLLLIKCISKDKYLFSFSSLGLLGICLEWDPSIFLCVLFLMCTPSILWLIRELCGMTLFLEKIVFEVMFYVL